MQTNDPDIYAAGDCVEILNLITGKSVHAPYGDLPIWEDEWPEKM